MYIIETKNFEEKITVMQSNLKLKQLKNCKFYITSDPTKKEKKYKKIKKIAKQLKQL